MNLLKLGLTLGLAVLMSNVPHVAFAESVTPKMIPTATVVEELTRGQTQAKIERILQEPELRERLAGYGLHSQEISKRLAALTDKELRDLNTQIEAARFGAESITGILIVVVLVLLIIFLAKRV